MSYSAPTGTKPAQDIISTAKEAGGAEYFVMFSFNRHITDNPFHAAERSYIEKACKDSGINFVYDNPPHLLGRY